MFYVCDGCGHIEVADRVAQGEEWTCSNCGNHAAWEFPPGKRNNAETHAAHIARGIRGGLFKNAARVGQ